MFRGLAKAIKPGFRYGLERLKITFMGEGNMVNGGSMIKMVSLARKRCHLSFIKRI